TPQSREAALWGILSAATANADDDAQSLLETYRRTKPKSPLTVARAVMGGISLGHHPSGLEATMRDAVAAAAVVDGVEDVRSGASAMVRYTTWTRILRSP